jgi:hypothetical protein
VEEADGRQEVAELTGEGDRSRVRVTHLKFKIVCCVNNHNFKTGGNI